MNRTKRQPWPVTNYCMVTNSQAVFTLSVKTFTDETSESVSFMIPLHMFVLEMPLLAIGDRLHSNNYDGY